MDLSSVTISVVGLGKSGQSVARFALARGARVTAWDEKDKSMLSPEVNALAPLGVELRQGQPSAQDLQKTNLVVVSPGVPLEGVLTEAKEKGISVISDVELAYRYIQAPVIAVTGTNGKSTVTTLIGEMLKADTRAVFMGANLGTPAIDAVEHPANTKDGWMVWELSSFQLESIETLAPHIAVCLSITPDHLSRHHTLAGYAAAKSRIFHYQRRADYAVVPDEDTMVKSLAKVGAASLHTFGRPEGQVRVVDQQIVDTSTDFTFPLDQFGLRGAHNRENACAAVLAARLARTKPEAIAHVLRTFQGLPHRMQYVLSLHEIVFYDDSKGTNVGATVTATEGLEQPFVLIAGGKDKGASYEPLVVPLQKKARAVVLLGESASLMAKTLSRAHLPIESVSTMKEAVAAAHRLAQRGDVVLFSPACASFDMYTSYVERGQDFQKCVRELAEERTP